MSKIEKAQHLNESEIDSQAELSRKLSILIDLMRTLPNTTGSEIRKEINRYSKALEGIEEDWKTINSMSGSIKQSAQTIRESSGQVSGLLKKIPDKLTLLVWCLIVGAVGAIFGASFYVITNGIINNRFEQPNEYYMSKANTLIKLETLATQAEINKMNEILKRTEKPKGEK